MIQIVVLGQHGGILGFFEEFRNGILVTPSATVIKFKDV